LGDRDTQFLQFAMYVWRKMAMASNPASVLKSPAGQFEIGREDQVGRVVSETTCRNCGHSPK
jgi:hypothetical protein